MYLISLNSCSIQFTIHLVKLLELTNQLTLKINEFICKFEKRIQELNPIKPYFYQEDEHETIFWNAEEFFFCPIMFTSEYWLERGTQYFI